MEEALAAQWAGYTWIEYLTLPGAEWWVDPDEGGDSKAMVLMKYRTAMRIEAIQQDF